MFFGDSDLFWRFEFPVVLSLGCGEFCQLFSFPGFHLCNLLRQKNFPQLNHPLSVAVRIWIQNWHSFGKHNVYNIWEVVFPILVASLPLSRFSFYNTGGRGCSPHLEIYTGSCGVNLAKVKAVEAWNLKGKRISTTSIVSNIYWTLIMDCPWVKHSMTIISFDSWQQLCTLISPILQMSKCRLEWCV